jgi:hypothetical protein
MTRLGGLMCDQTGCTTTWTYPREPVRAPWAHRLTPIWDHIEGMASSAGWLIRGSRAYCPDHAHLIAAGELEPSA